MTSDVRTILDSARKLLAADEPYRADPYLISPALEKRARAVGWTFPYGVPIPPDPRDNQGAAPDA